MERVKASPIIEKDTSLSVGERIYNVDVSTIS